MDPLSITTRFLAILHATRRIAQHLKDVKTSRQDTAQAVQEISSLTKLLETVSIMDFACHPLSLLNSISCDFSNLNDDLMSLEKEVMELVSQKWKRRIVWPIYAAEII